MRFIEIEVEFESRSDSQIYTFNHDVKFMLHILLNLVFYLNADRISLSDKVTE